VKNNVYKGIAILIGVVAGILWFYGVPILKVITHNPPESQFRRARDHLQIHLHDRLQEYAAEHENRYPHADKWCDLLFPGSDLGQRLLFCPFAGDTGNYVTNDPNNVPDFPGPMRITSDYYDHEKGERIYIYEVSWSHFALNPKAEPNSPGDVVLLFSTKGGWNQFGGPEILGTENYRKAKHEGAYILFNSGRIEFVKPEDLGKLNWGNKK